MAVTVAVAAVTVAVAAVVAGASVGGGGVDVPIRGKTTTKNKKPCQNNQIIMPTRYLLTSRFVIRWHESCFFFR